MRCPQVPATTVRFGWYGKDPGMRREVESALRSHGIIDLKQHPQLRHSARLMHRAGTLTRLLPGILAATSDAAEPGTRILAAAHWSPDVVLLGRAAAWLTFWPSIRVDHVMVASPTRLAPQRGFESVRQRIPAELVERRGGVSCTAPALSALDLVPELGGAGIDEVLRTGTARLSDLWQALEGTTGRHGNAVRRQLLIDSRDAPWSEAERLLHRLLREAGLTGWSTNLSVARGTFQCFVDAAFPALKVGIEVDGFAFHSAQLVGRSQFGWDRYRDATLVVHGWRMLHFTWTHLTDQPEWVIDTVRATLTRARRA